MFHLVCVHPFAKYKRGQKITDQGEVENLLRNREHHFVKVAVPAEASPPNLVEMDGAEYQRIH